MTQNQIAAQANMIKRAADQEQARHNQATERETKRKNLESEKLEARGQNLSLISNLGGNAIKGLTSLIPGKTGAKNHPSWTNRFPDLTKLISSLPADIPYGDSTVLTNYLMNGSATSKVDPALLPSVVCYRYVPTLGNSDQDALRVVSAQMYTWLRSVNSGSRNYERSDLILYLVYGSSIVSLFAYAAKILALANTFSKTNTSVGKAVISALTNSGASTWNTLMNDRAALVAKFNVLARRFNSFFLPAVFPVIQRWMWMAGFASRSYENTELGPIIVTRPEAYYIYSTDDPTGGTDTSGKMKPMAIPNSASLNTILDIISDCIDAFFDNEDMAIIAGDIHHAFGESETNYVRLNPIDVGVTMDLYHSKEDLTEFMNADVVGPVTLDSLYIYQDGVNHDLVQKGAFNGTLTNLGVDIGGICSRTNLSGDHAESILYLPESITPIIINDATTKLSPEDLMKYTSFKTRSQEQMVLNGSDGYWYRVIKEFRTEVITQVVLYNGKSTEIESLWYDFQLVNLKTTTTPGANIKSLSQRSPIDYLKYVPYIPAMRLLLYDSTVPIIAEGKAYPNFTTQALIYTYSLPNGAFDGMLDIALMSLYGMDTFGTSQRFQGKFDVRK